jgi:hypothetical protein
MYSGAPSLPNSTLPRVIDSRHPNFHSNTLNWTKWRLTYEGGEAFRDKYLKEFSKREEHDDYITRRDMSPIPTFAKSAINDIRNAIFQRMRDILRTGGSDNYRKAVGGLELGVDRRGATMNAFLGVNVLTDLLIMGRVGVFVDNSIVEGGTLAESQGARPYLYPYQVEDICSWTCARPDAPGEYQAILLRDTCVDYDLRTFLPLRTFHRFRSMWIDKKTGFVNLQFYDLEGNKITRDGLPGTGEPYVLELTRIPFVMLDIGDSLLKDACEYQIALLNLVSSDVNYAVKANFTFYVEQQDLRAVGGHLKRATSEDGTATAGGQAGKESDIKVGATQGRAYDKGMQAPSFIHPSSEPLKASMDLQAKLEDDIAFIKYPDRYSLKTDADRIDEATKLSELMFKVPGREVKREIAKNIVITLLGGKVDVETIKRITDEISNAKYLTSDPQTIIQAVQAGLCGEQTGSTAIGFEDNEYLQARNDHVARIERIAEAQGIGNPPVPGKPGSDPASRGVPDLSADPANAGAAEKAAQRNTDLNPSTKPPVRGKGQP